ncbi:hypothetical protein [Streptomyces sp. TN58]|uniref:hypothetical protein n=1 Tax=Streptomyces sp. TN58 TaxID=234612 RepID=UPI003B63E403
MTANSPPVHVGYPVRTRTHLVGALADDWGVVGRSPGKIVWCEFRLGCGGFAGAGREV